MKTYRVKHKIMDGRNDLVFMSQILIVCLILSISTTSAQLVGPDLIVTDMDAPATIDVGEHVSVSFTIQNVGNASTNTGLFRLGDIIVISKSDHPWEDNLTGFWPGSNRYYP